MRNNLEKPDGTKESPAKTCKDLFRDHPLKEEGYYWIDPKGKDPKEAIYVYCKKDTEETCILPSPNTTKIFTTKDGGWLSDLENGVPFSYKIDKVQLRFLTMNSEKASQDIIYHCHNTVAHFDEKMQNYNQSLQLYSSDKRVIRSIHEAEGPKNAKNGFFYTILEDGCKKREQKWSKTKIHFETDHAEVLPIMDVHTRDVKDILEKVLNGSDPSKKGKKASRRQYKSSEKREFRVEVGPACFR